MNPLTEEAKERMPIIEENLEMHPLFKGIEKILSYLVEREIEKRMSN